MPKSEDVPSRNKNKRNLIGKLFLDLLCKIGLNPLKNKNLSNKSRTEESSQMQKKLRKFAKIEAGDIMIPRSDIIAASKSTSLSRLKTLFLHEEHSRIPIYKDSIDDVEGFIHIKDLFKALANKNKLKLADMLREIIFVPETIPVSELLKQMQKSKIHIAIVLDEYGATSGLISIEDIVEQLVGDIRDEYDAHEGIPFTKLSNTEFVFDCKTKISDVEKIIGVEFFNEKNADFDTLAGYIMMKFGYIPKRGENIEPTPGLIIEVMEASPKLVVSARIAVNRAKTTQNHS